MNVHARRRKIKIGIAFIEDAIADVLTEAGEKGEGPIRVRQIRERVGLPEEDRNRHLLNSILAGMEINGEVIPPPTDSYQQNRWELANR